jgi:hypothetical protein
LVFGCSAAAEGVVAWVQGMTASRCTVLDYIDFLLATPKVVSATEAARVQPDRPHRPAHNAFTRLLHRLEPDPEDLWQEVGPFVARQGGLLVLSGRKPVRENRPSGTRKRAECGHPSRPNNPLDASSPRTGDDTTSNPFADGGLAPPRRQARLVTAAPLRCHRPSAPFGDGLPSLSWAVL